MFGKLHHIAGIVKGVGLLNTVNILTRRFFKLKTPVSIYYRRNDGSNTQNRIIVRPTESDIFVAGQIFGWQDYTISPVLQKKLNRMAHEWEKEKSTPVIIDGGGNVGYSAIYFSEIFPKAVILAVEPDPATCEIMKKNTANHPHIKVVHGALWKDNEGVALDYSDQNGSWATRTIAADRPDLTPSYTIEEMLKKVPDARLLILKLDIEGAEKQVCEASANIIHDVPYIVIEPHDFMLGGEACLSPLFKAIAGRKVDTLIQGENLVLIDSNLCTN